MLSKHVINAALILLAVVPACTTAAPQTGELNPPQWPPTVRVFKPTDTDIQDTINAA